MELLKAIIGIIVVIAIVGFIIYRNVFEDRIKARRSEKQSDSSEPKERQ